jgi:hypothetical protein
MQAYRIHKCGIPHDQSGDYAVCGYLNAACTSSTDERLGGNKRPAISSLPGRARRSSPYLSSSPIDRGSRRRRRDA